MAALRPSSKSRTVLFFSGSKEKSALTTKNSDRRMEGRGGEGRGGEGRGGEGRSGGVEGGVWSVECGVWCGGVVVWWCVWVGGG